MLFRSAEGARTTDNQNLHSRDSHNPSDQAEPRVAGGMVAQGDDAGLQPSQDTTPSNPAGSVLEELEQEGTSGQTHRDQHPEQCGGAEDFRGHGPERCKGLPI